MKFTYADGLPVYIEEDGRIHGKFNQTITATRTDRTATDPNLQNIPIPYESLEDSSARYLRREKDGYFWMPDYSQIELRVLKRICPETRSLSKRIGENKEHSPLDGVQGIPYSV